MGCPAIPKELIKKKIAEILAGLGLLEISNYHLTTKKDQFTKMGIPEKQEKGFLVLYNSLIIVFGQLGLYGHNEFTNNKACPSFRVKEKYQYLTEFNKS